jgi:hypothetical protein
MTDKLHRYSRQQWHIDAAKREAPTSGDVEKRLELESLTRPRPALPTFKIRPTKRKPRKPA